MKNFSSLQAGKAHDLVTCLFC